MKTYLIFLMLFSLSTVYADADIKNIKVNNQKINFELKLLENKLRFKVYHLSAKAKRMAPALLRKWGDSLYEKTKKQIPSKYRQEYNELINSYNNLYDLYLNDDHKKLKKEYKIFLAQVDTLKNQDLKKILKPYLDQIEWTENYISGKEETNPLSDLAYILLLIFEEEIKVKEGDSEKIDNVTDFSKEKKGDKLPKENCVNDKDSFVLTWLNKYFKDCSETEKN